MKKNAKKMPGNKQKLSGSALTKRIIIIAASALVGIAVILGAVLGITSAVKRSSYVMSLDGFGIDAPVACYLSSVFKSMYMQSLVQNHTSPVYRKKAGGSCGRADGN